MPIGFSKQEAGEDVMRTRSHLRERHASVCESEEKKDNLDGRGPPVLELVERVGLILFALVEDAQIPTTVAEMGSTCSSLQQWPWSSANSFGELMPHVWLRKRPPGVNDGRETIGIDSSPPSHTIWRPAVGAHWNSAVRQAPRNTV
jgi:hypothetical protein